MNKEQQAKFDKIMKNCHLPTRLDMAKLIKVIEEGKENCFTYGEGYQAGNLQAQQDEISFLEKEGHNSENRETKCRFCQRHIKLSEGKFFSSQP